MGAGVSAEPSQSGETNCAFVPEPAGSPRWRTACSLPPQGGAKPPNSAQTAEIFQALQQECMRQLQVPAGSPGPLAAGVTTSPRCPRVPIPGP